MNNIEKKYSKRMKCPYCNRNVPMEIVARYNQIETISDDDMRMQYEEGYYYELLLCASCNDVILQSKYYFEPWGEEQELPKILFPSEEKPVLGLPETVKKSYEAALKIRKIDTNAFAILLGRVLEVVCKDRNAEGVSLHAKLQYLADNGEMPKQLVKMAHSLRQLRNIGAHPDLGELSDKEIPFLDGLCKAILEYIYSAPKLLEVAQARLNEISKT
ncbi:MAG: DUF4145 domain-containing protein [Candidatus Margulisbacteria bacterium]|nr:DUF4145 domain-containing protein [Candidatus Margulisiibacteriota bacterium]